MAAPVVRIGMAVRPEGSLAYGTIGCIAKRRGVPHLVTCDHVMGPPPRCLYPEFDGSSRSPFAEYRGLSLAGPDPAEADLVAAPILAPAAFRPRRLPAPLPGDGGVHIRGLAPVVEGQSVEMWGARSDRYIRGTIVQARSAEALPHPRLGKVVFRLQCALQVDPAHLPGIGDSGGPVLTGSGLLVGFLMAGPSSCARSGPYGCLAFAVPAKEALARLGLQLLPGEKET